MRSLQTILLLLLIVAVALALSVYRIPITPMPQETDDPENAKLASEAILGNFRLAFAIVGHGIVFVGLLAGFLLWRMTLAKRILPIVTPKAFLLVSLLPALVFFIALLIKPAGDVYTMFIPLFGGFTAWLFGAIVAVFSFLMHGLVSLVMEK